MADSGTRKGVINGVDVDALFATIEAVKADPAIAAFKFNTKNQWVMGGHNHATVLNFYGAKEEHAHAAVFEADADEPAVLLGTDKGPNPVEHLLIAVSGCVTSAIVYHSAARGITLRGVSSRLEGDLDLRGFLGISPDVPVGYQEIRLYFTIDADLSREEKEALVQMGAKYSPVFNTISHATPVKALLDK
ncbi:MAG: OsmC family protein [Deltaproteobacteria bacterium]|nr:OsmC family protein [Deltaproteobacteria bacterium]